VARPDQPLASERIVVFDTETTGLSPTLDHVIEIAALALENGAETGRFESLIDPGVPIPPELTAIHRITDEMVRGQPRFAQVARRFLDFAGDSILAAHNAVYDVSMMMPPLVAAGLRPAGNPVLDTCRLARRLVQAPNYQLGTVARTLSIEMPVSHRAMADAEACAGVLRALLARMGGGATLADAERISALRLSFGTGSASSPIPAAGNASGSGSGSAPGAALPARLAPLADAIRTGASVAIVYRGGSHGDGPRGITPLFLLEIDGSLCVSAHCHIEKTLKNFRVDRITRVLPP